MQTNETSGSNKAPDAFKIIVIILLGVTALTWIIPAGEFDYKTITRPDGHEVEVVVAGSFHAADSNPQILEIFTAPFHGFLAVSDIIAFLFLVAGAFAIINKTGSVNAGLQTIIRAAKRRPGIRMVILPLLIFTFSICGCTWGMAEETLLFLIPTIPLVYALGYDAIVAVAITMMAAFMGFAAAMFNPFTVGIAQGIAGLPTFSGWEFRFIPWFLYTSITALFVMFYARRISRRPESSLLHGIVKLEDLQLEKQEEVEFTTSRKLVLLAFFVGLVILMIGVGKWGWSVTEIAGLFLAVGVFSALICRMKAQTAINSFLEGAGSMVMVVVLVALARSIQIVAEDGMIMHTILYHVARLVEGLPAYVSVQVMFFVQGIINFFIPSGSGQAAVTMPIMAPLGDLLGISRQTTVLAYQFGDGLFNLVIPTNAVLMAALAMAKIPFKIWIKWIAKLMVILILTSMILLAIATTLTW